MCHKGNFAALPGCEKAITAPPVSMPSNEHPEDQDQHDNPRHTLDKGPESPGDMEFIAHRDSLEEQRAREGRALTEERKVVFEFIRANPGCDQESIQKATDSLSGVDEWVREKLLVKQGLKYYVKGSEPKETA